MSVLPHPIIERIRIKNYRSLADVDVQLSPLTVLVGTNGSGKSNVIDALRFVRDAITRGLDTALLDRGGMSSIRRWSPTNTFHDITIQLYVRGEDWVGMYGFTIGGAKPGEYKVKWEKLSVKERGSKTIFLEAKDGESVRFSGALGRVPVGSPTFSFDQHLLLPKISPPFFSSSKKVTQTLSDMGFYNIYPDDLKLPQKPSNSHPLEENGQNIASVLMKIKENRYADDMIKIALSKVVEGIYDYAVTPVGSFLVTSLYHNIADGGQNPAFDLAQESDGTLRMLAILAAIYQDPSRSLLAIEEPELNIHPGALGVLCDFIKEAGARSQVIVTTHNPDLIDRFPAESLRVVEMEHGTTKVELLSKIQREVIASRLFSPGELMRIERLYGETTESVAER